MATVIKGDAELRRKLAKLKDFKTLEPVLAGLVTEVKGEVSKYAPPTAANVPGGPGSQWYQRGYGSKWMRMDGTVGGRATSEDLGQKWTIRKTGTLKYLIGNNVKYGPYVKDPDKQAQALKNIGWTNTDEDVRKKEKKVLDELHKAVDRILQS